MTKERYNIFWRSLFTVPILGLINLFGITLYLENSSQAIAQSTEVPMTLEFGEGMYTMTVPNQDTTQSAYGGQLRLYDVHVAKMFEMTYDDCQQMQRQYGQDAGGRNWFYQAGNGSINMGEFYISCNLANQIVETYGLGQSEPTVVKNFVEHTGVNTETRSIPILDITGSKVSQWINFVQGFKSRR
jgi:serine/threonine-protein kinase